MSRTRKEGRISLLLWLAIQACLRLAVESTLQSLGHVFIHRLVAGVLQQTDNLDNNNIVVFQDSCDSGEC